MKKIFILLSFLILLSCAEEKKSVEKASAPKAKPLTVLKVIYHNGDQEELKVPAYPDDIWLSSYEGSASIRYTPPNDEGAVIIGNIVVATNVRRFEVLRSNYKSTKYDIGSSN